MDKPKDWIKIEDIAIVQNRITIGFSYSSGLSRFFVNNIMAIDYSQDVRSSENSFAVIPFICNVLPIVWLTDAILYIDEIDYDFYHCICNIKKGYQEIYPNLSFLGDIRVNNIKKTESREKYNKSICLFSGGVDATATLLHHYSEKPSLAFVLGADIPCTDTKSGESMYNHIKMVASNLGLGQYLIVSNFREYINELALCKYLDDLSCSDDWWHGFQHGIGLLGHLAPLCRTEKIGNVYIASSYTIRERGTTTCASDPRIDNHLLWNGSHVFHDLFELSRQEKIGLLVNSKSIYGTKVIFPLHVCWVNKDDKNCGKCEKCYRTYFGLLAEGVDPKDYGLHLPFGKKISCIYRLLLTIEISNNIRPLWRDIKKRVSQQNTFWSMPFLLKFIYIINIDRIGKAPIRRLKRACRTIV